MITPRDLENLTDVSTVDKVYDELFSHGLNAFRTATNDSKIKVFSKICLGLIKQYVEWNDYIHSNNIMQLYKDTVLVSDRVKKPSWYIRYEIIIYGRRTPLYFIDEPRALFDRMDAVFSSRKETQTTKLTGAVINLCNYYGANFLSTHTSPDDKKLFVAHINDCFAKEYAETDKTAFPNEVRQAIKDIVDYAENPSSFIRPGIPISVVDIWDEDDEIGNGNDGALTSPDAPDDDSENELKYLDGKTIKFIGDIKNSVIDKIKYWASKYGFEADITSDYDKITNLDFRKFRYSNKYAAIIAGPMPHSVKGKGNYSSGLEMLKNETGYPDVFECITNDKLKVTPKSAWNALSAVNFKMMSM